MRRADLTELVAFTALAEHLSFRGAAARLGVTPSALSHTMRQLEDRLGVRLFHRTTRSVALTDAGQHLIERVGPAIGQIADALVDLDQARRQPSGALRIYATSWAAACVIAPVWSRFLSTYPDVRLEVQVNEQPADVVAEGFDAGIGPHNRAAADMIAVRVLGPLKIAVVGAPDYFLADHICIQYRVMAANGALFEWSFKRDGQSRRLAVNGPVIVNTFELALRAAVDALGLAYTLEAFAAPLLDSGQLVRVLEDWSPSFEGMFLYYSGHHQVPAALRALIDMIRGADALRLASTGDR